MNSSTRLVAQALTCLLISAGVRALGDSLPVLTWIPGSSTNLEQIIGDTNWADLAIGITNFTASLTERRFHILGNGHGYSFEDKGKLIFLFGDTISEDKNTWSYAAHDPLAWSTNTDGESPLVLNFYTNRPYAYSSNTPVFVQPDGIDMGGDDIPGSGISLSNGVFLICTTGYDSVNKSASGEFSVLVTFDETNLLTATNTYQPTNFFVTNRTVSALNPNLATNDLRQGHFILTSLHEFGTNVLVLGVGENRASDVYLSMVPTSNFVSGQGTLYFTGLTNGQPTWSPFESNSVPVVQDNPTNGPAWPDDNPNIHKVSVIYSTAINLWLMTYDGGGNTLQGGQTEGIYFSYAPQPWGPWATPQLIFNEFRDHGKGIFIYDAANHTGPAGPVIGGNVDPTTRPGEAAGPFMIERFTRVTTTNTLFIYYTMSTWNPYTVVKMRSEFTITPVIDLASLLHKKNKFSFSWNAPTNAAYQVDYSGDLLSGWTTFTDIVTSTTGMFNYTNTQPGGLPAQGFYRLRSAPP